MSIRRRGGELSLSGWGKGGPGRVRVHWLNSERRGVGERTEGKCDAIEF